MYTYLIFNIAVIIFPFLLSFDRKVAFWRKWPRLLFATVLTDLIFVTWDSRVTEIGHWSFNDDHLTGIWIFGIPLEELLFFITVPYACLFTFEVIRSYFKDWKVPFKVWPYVLISMILMGSAFLFIEQGYTFIVLIYTAITIIAALFLHDSTFKARSFWIYILITMALFAAFNMVLTAIPVVEYSPQHIWGGDGLFNGRFFTIPLEDFFYNISMLTTYLIFYLVAGRLPGRRSSRHEE